MIQGNQNARILPIFDPLFSDSIGKCWPDGNAGGKFG
jgi:hypothetical protein